MAAVARKADALARLCSAALDGPARLVIKAQQRAYAAKVLSLTNAQFDALPDS
jgi:hypothetical protein